MGDIVERLKEAHPHSAQRWAGSTILLDAAAEITRLRAEVERLQGDENGMSTETVGSYAVGHLREMYRAAYDALGPSGRVSLRNHINNMVRRREAEERERAAQIAEGLDWDWLGGPSAKRHVAAAIRQAASGESGT